MLFAACDSVACGVPKLAARKTNHARVCPRNTKEIRLFVLIYASPRAENIFPALQTRLRFLAHHFLDAGPKILENYRSCISPGSPGDRSARMRRGSGLI